MLLTDHAEILQLYELYKSMSFSEESISIRKKISEKISLAVKKYTQHNQYTVKEHEKYIQEIQDLDNYNEGKEMKYKILNLNTSKSNKRIIYGQYKRYLSVNSDNDVYEKLKYWLEWATCLPYDNYKIFPFDKKNLTSFLHKVESKMNDELYGMKSVKEQILIFLNAKITNPAMKNCSLGLIGPPGTGKTYISRLLATILDFPFQQISFGGITDPNFLKGHQSTYIGAEPGEIIRCLRKMKYKNGILFLDEFDKVSENKDICSALLHILDPEQQQFFSDNFLAGLTMDISCLWYIYSMNNLPTDTALRDRLFTIKVDGYSHQDKLCILRDYLLPRALKNVNMDVKSVILSDTICKYIVTRVSSEEESGVRTLDRSINSIIKKIAFLKDHQDKKGQIQFNISFNVNKMLKFPLHITQKLIDIFMDS
jgi:ATP-dependent Lon protease